MNAVYYFSGSGNSRRVAEALAQALGVAAQDITLGGVSGEEQVAAVVFPVYCQNIPKNVVRFLKTLRAPYAVLIATFGRISFGNVICEAEALTDATVIAAACVPMGHSFLQEEYGFDVSLLAPLLARIQAPQPATLSASEKDAFADIFPALRSRIGMRISKAADCNRCGLCDTQCPTGAMQSGKIGASCIRCMRCVSLCPKKALRPKPRRILKRYLLRNLNRICTPIYYL